MSHRRPKHVRKILDGAERIALAHGLRLSLETGGYGGHPRLVIEGRGKRRITPVSSSPTDRDAAIRFKLADVKKICREICA